MRLRFLIDQNIVSLHHKQSLRLFKTVRIPPGDGDLPVFEAGEPVKGGQVC
jgi:hypothetical protein